MNWRSHRLKRVVRSTLCGETIACVNAIEAALVVQKLIDELSKNFRIPILVWTDNRSLVQAVYSTKIPHDKG